MSLFARHFLAQRTTATWSVVVFAITCTVYVLTMPRVITLEDGGLFQMVCHEGGIGHPPGYPLFVLTCQFFVDLPFFEKTVFAGNFLSAIFASLTCAVLVLVIDELLGSRQLAVIVSLIYGLSATFWSQAIVIEVYSLAALLFVCCFLFCLRFSRSGSQRELYPLAFFYGLALSNHWPLLGLATPALLALVIPQWRGLMQALGSIRVIAPILACLALGLSPYLALFQTEPVIAVFGAIETWEQFANYVFRAAYDDQFAVANLQDKFQYQHWLVIQTLLEYSPLAIPFILGGLWLSFRELPKQVAISLVLLYLGATSLLVMLLGFEFSDFRLAIFRPYPIIAYLAPAIWIGLGCRWLFLRLEDNAPGLTRFVPLVLVLAVGLYNLPHNNRAQDEFADRYGRTVLAMVPKDAVLFVTGDNGVGLLGYLHHVEGVRPDLELRSWNSLVFNNRLTSAFAPQAFLDSTRSDFIAESKRPVVSAMPPDFRAVNQGILFHYTDKPGYTCDPALHQYVSYLLEMEKNVEVLADGHERDLLFGLLLQFTRQHLGIVLFNQTSAQAAVLEDEVAVLTRLQETFAGSMATLETLLQQPLNPHAKPILEAIAVKATSRLPMNPSSQIEGLLLEYRGRIALKDPPDFNQAARYLERSIQIYPIAENASRCLLAEIARDNGVDHPIAISVTDMQCE